MAVLTAPTKHRTKLITGEELLAMGDIGRCELIDGRLVFRSPTDVEEYDAEAILRGEGVLDGFAVKVAELFAE